jgi:hypothetical protein
MVDKYLMTCPSHVTESSATAQNPCVLPALPPRTPDDHWVPALVFPPCAVVGVTLYGLFGSAPVQRDLWFLQVFSCSIAHFYLAITKIPLPTLQLIFPSTAEGLS